MPQNEFLCPKPSSIQITEPAVAVAVRVLLAVLLPPELQGDVFVGLQFVADSGVVRLGRFVPPGGFFPPRGRGLPPHVFTPIGNVWPFQPRRLGDLQVFGNRRLTDGTTGGYLAL